MPPPSECKRKENEKYQGTLQVIADALAGCLAAAIGARAPWLAGLCILSAAIAVGTAARRATEDLKDCDPPSPLILDIGRL